MFWQALSICRTSMLTFSASLWNHVKLCLDGASSSVIKTCFKQSDFNLDYCHGSHFECFCVSRLQYLFVCNINGILLKMTYIMHNYLRTLSLIFHFELQCSFLTVYLAFVCCKSPCSQPSLSIIFGEKEMLWPAAACECTRTQDEDILRQGSPRPSWPTTNQSKLYTCIYFASVSLQNGCVRQNVNKG